MAILFHLFNSCLQKESSGISAISTWKNCALSVKCTPSSSTPSSHRCTRNSSVQTVTPLRGQQGSKNKKQKPFYKMRAAPRGLIPCLFLSLPFSNMLLFSLWNRLWTTGAGSVGESETKVLRSCFHAFPPEGCVEEWAEPIFPSFALFLVFNPYFRHWFLVLLILGESLRTWREKTKHVHFVPPQGSCRWGISEIWQGASEDAQRLGATQTPSIY